MGSFVRHPAGLVTSRDIVVRVVSAYIPQRSDLSDPSHRKYVFAYRIAIENCGLGSVKLLSRHWWITDAHEWVQEVEGEGVVGQQPVIAPGEAFSYVSWCVLATPAGRMRGTYTMVAASGEAFEVPIPPFNLTTGLGLN